MNDALRRITLGRIAGVFGVKGWVKLLSFTEPVEAILDYREWWLGESTTPVKLLQGRLHGTGLVAQIANAEGQLVEDRDAATRWVGSVITVPRSALPKARKNEVYLVDLVGMAVKSSSGVALGVVELVTSNGAQDVLVLRDAAVKDEAGEPVQRLIPFVRGPIIESVSLKSNEIVAHWQPDW